MNNSTTMKPAMCKTCGQIHKVPSHIADAAARGILYECKPCREKDLIKFAREHRGRLVV